MSGTVVLPPRISHLLSHQRPQGHRFARLVSTPLDYVCLPTMHSFPQLWARRSALPTVGNTVSPLVGLVIIHDFHMFTGGVSLETGESAPGRASPAKAFSHPQRFDTGAILDLSQQVRERLPSLKPPKARVPTHRHLAHGPPRRYSRHLSAVGATASIAKHSDPHGLRLSHPVRQDRRRRLSQY